LKNHLRIVTLRHKRWCSFCEFSLCLSRACLGKYSVSSTRLRKSGSKEGFFAPERFRLSRAGRSARNCPSQQHCPAQNAGGDSSVLCDSFPVRVPSPSWQMIPGRKEEEENGAKTAAVVSTAPRARSAKERPTPYSKHNARSRGSTDSHRRARSASAARSRSPSADLASRRGARCRAAGRRAALPCRWPTRRPLRRNRLFFFSTFPMFVPSCLG
jgi:hypothetical protein